MPAAIANTTTNANALCTILRNPTTSSAEPTRTMAMIQKRRVAKSIKNTPQIKYAISIVSCTGFIKHVYSYEILAKRLTSGKGVLKHALLLCYNHYQAHSQPNAIL